MVEQGVDKGAGGIARCGVHDHSGGFVQHEEIVVFVKNFERNCLRFGACDRCGIWFMDRDKFAGAEFFSRFGGVSPHEDVPFFDERLEPRTGEVGQLRSEKVVQAKTGGIGGDEIFRHFGGLGCKRGLRTSR